MAIYEPSDLVPLRVLVTDPTTGLAANSGALTFTVTRPDGTTYTTAAVTPSPVGTYDHDVDVAATATGSAGGGGQSGMFTWRAVAASPNAGEFDGWFIVRSRRSAGPGWVPELDAVADFIPYRTLSSLQTPGVESYLGTFTDTTTPTGEQVRRLIDAAVGHTVASVGTMYVAPSGATTAQVAAAQLVNDLARGATACRAAAMVELAYPLRAQDWGAYDRLIALADQMTGELKDANVTATGLPSDLAQSLLPQWAYPTPVVWGDKIIP